MVRTLSKSKIDCVHPMPLYKTPRTGLPLKYVLFTIFVSLHVYKYLSGHSTCPVNMVFRAKHSHSLKEAAALPRNQFCLFLNIRVLKSSLNCNIS